MQRLQSQQCTMVILLNNGTWDQDIYAGIKCIVLKMFANFYMSKQVGDKYMGAI